MGRWIRDVIVHVCSGVDWLMSDSGRLGRYVLFYRWLAGTDFWHFSIVARRMEGGWRENFRVEAGEGRLCFRNAKWRILILLKSSVGESMHVGST